MPGLKSGAATVQHTFAPPLARWIVAALAAVTISTTTHAQRASTFNWQGVVRDSASGEVLPHAHVQLTELRRVGETNADGRFTFLSVPSGTFTLTVQTVGYSMRSIKIRADSIKTPIVLTLARVVTQLAEATIKGEVANLAPGVSGAAGQISISAAQVEAMPALGEADVFRALQMLPSVAGAGDGTASLSVRSGLPDQNLVLLDGMTVYHVDHFFGLFSAFNADALKDIQLYAGGYPARYGGRISSVLDLTGKAGDEHVFRASVGANLLSARSVVEVPLGKGSLLFSARRSYSDVIKSGLYSKLFSFAESQGTTATSTGGGGLNGVIARFQQAVIQPSYYFYDLNSKLTYRPSSKDVVAISYYSGEDNLDQSQSLQIGGGRGGIGGTTTTTAASSSLDDITTWGNRGVSARWFRQWSNRLSSDALVASSRYDSNGDRTASGGLPNGGPRFDFGYTETNKVDDVTLRLDNSLQVATWSRVEFGLWATNNKVHYDFSVATTDTAQQRRNTVRDGKATLTAAYAQHTFTPISAIDITTGVRFNQYDATNKSYVEPRISGSWQVTPELKFKGAYGQYHQFVNRVENEDVLQGSRDFWLLSDSILKPSAAQHKILGFLYEKPNWALNVEGYHKDLQNVALFSRRYRQSIGVNTGSFFYTGTSKADGLEFLLEKKSSPITGWISYTLAQAKDTYADIDQGVAFPSSLDQRHELKGFGAWLVGKWEFAATGIYGSGRPYTSPESQYQVKLLDGTSQTYIHVGSKNGERLPFYGRADLSVTRTFTPKGYLDYHVGLSLYNVSNRHNVSFRKFDLSTDPLSIVDVTQLGFTPSIDLKITLRDYKHMTENK